MIFNRGYEYLEAIYSSCVINSIRYDNGAVTGRPRYHMKENRSANSFEVFHNKSILFLFINKS